MVNNYINYIEFKANDLGEIKDFYNNVFGWKFVNYGPEYIAFSESGIEGGFEKTEEKITNGALIIIYNDNLEGVKDLIIRFGGEISKDIFSFPGGKRLHFIDPSGNELSVWSDK